MMRAKDDDRLFGWSEAENTWNFKVDYQVQWVASGRGGRTLMINFDNLRVFQQKQEPTIEECLNAYALLDPIDILQQKLDEEKRINQELRK